MSSDGISDRWNQTKREAKNEVAGENKCGFENTVYVSSIYTEQSQVEKQIAGLMCNEPCKKWDTSRLCSNVRLMC